MVETKAKSTDIDVLLQELSEARQFMVGRVEEGVKPLKEEVERVATSLKEVQDGLNAIRRQRIALIGDDGRMRLRAGRFAGFDMFDLRALESILEYQARRNPAKGAFLEAVLQAKRDLRASVNEEAILAWHDASLKRRAVMPRGVAVGSVLGPFQDTLSQWTRQLIATHLRAMDSTTAAAGDELVPTFEEAELWMDVNLETLVLPLLPQFNMPTNPFDIPAEFGDTNWYPTTENVQSTTTDLTTSKTTLTAYGLKTGVPFSDELSEDAIIAFVPELRSKLVRNAAEIIDNVLLNGDTTVLNGINSDGATISKTTAGKAHWLLGFDGLIHLPLVDNTAQSVDKTAAIDADIFNRILALLGKYAVPRRAGEVVYIADVRTALRALSITEVETLDVAGVRATLSTGELLSLYGKPLVQSEQMVPADTDGKVTNSGNVTTTGRILCVNTTQWRVGFKRGITLETDREPGKSQTTMYVSFRIALAERTGTRSTATHTSLAYDITGI